MRSCAVCPFARQTVSCVPAVCRVGRWNKCRYGRLAGQTRNRRSISPVGPARFYIRVGRREKRRFRPRNRIPDGVGCGSRIRSPKRCPAGAGRGRRLRMPANGAARLRFVRQTERICRINMGTYFVAWFGFSDGLKAKLPCCRLKRPFKICLVRAWAVVAAQSVVCSAASR